MGRGAKSHPLLWHCQKHFARINMTRSMSYKPDNEHSIVCRYVSKRVAKVKNPLALCFQRRCQNSTFWSGANVERCHAINKNTSWWSQRFGLRKPHTRHQHGLWQVHTVKGRHNNGDKAVLQ